MEFVEYQKTVEARAKKLGSIEQDLMHAHLGMSTETGEVGDIVKKAVIYGKPIDVPHMREELGDLLWYLAHAANAIGASLAEIAAENDAKLEKRYPRGYTNADALARADKVQGE